MRIALRLVTALVLLALALPGGRAWGQGGTSRGGRWDYLLMPSFWIPAIAGELTVEGIEFRTAAGPGDPEGRFNYAAQLRLEAWRGRWGLYGEPTFLQLSDEGTLAVPIFGNIDAVARVQQLSGELGGWYRLAGRPSGAGAGPGLRLDLLAAARFGVLKEKLEVPLPLLGTVQLYENSRSWVEPIVGARLQAGRARGLQLLLKGDIAGFGLNSYFSWNATGLIGFAFSERVSLWGGYRGSGVTESEELQVDLVTSGPLAGLSLRFPSRR